jgi:hypothetical protein
MRVCAKFSSNSDICSPLNDRRLMSRQRHPHSRLVALYARA